jgi:hypothetical protein
VIAPQLDYIIAISDKEKEIMAQYADKRKLLPFPISIILKLIFLSEKTSVKVKELSSSVLSMNRILTP